MRRRDQRAARRRTGQLRDLRVGLDDHLLQLGDALQHGDRLLVGVDDRFAIAEAGDPRGDALDPLLGQGHVASGIAHGVLALPGVHAVDQALRRRDQRRRYGVGVVRAERLGRDLGDARGRVERNGNLVQVMLVEVLEGVAGVGPGKARQQVRLGPREQGAHLDRLAEFLQRVARQDVVVHSEGVVLGAAEAGALQQAAEDAGLRVDRAADDEAGLGHVLRRGDGEEVTGREQGGEHDCQEKRCATAEAARRSKPERPA